MLILTLIDVQYLQKVISSFEKSSKGQNHSSSGSHHPIKNSPPAKFLIPLPPHWEGNFPTHSLTLFGKPWTINQDRLGMPLKVDSLNIRVRKKKNYH